MKRTCLLACTVALVTLCSCTVKEQRLGYDDATGGVVLTALTDMPGVRTGVVDGGTEVFWESQEEIKVFAGTSSAKFVSANTDLASKADFIGPSDFSVAPGKPVVAVYPYSDDVAYDGECITMTLPSEQVACPGTFARGTNIAVAKSDTHTLQFRNVCGGLRFSVTEEGITKVIFEGLGGEMIAGKVQVAVDDAGLPVVKSVSNGSPFITVQAPDGQSLEVGKWYYIVAIPGALDKGFKLRFYKDDTYARYTSETAVQVKRSVFGSLADADEGVEYEAQTTHFPTTEEEIKASYELCNEISLQVSCILDNQADDYGDIIQQINDVEGVADLHLNKDSTALILTQRDGVIVNYLLNVEQVEPISQTKVGSSSITPMSLLNNVRCPNNKKALFMDAFFDKPFEDYLIPFFESIDYTADFFTHEVADISKFTGQFMDNYGLIYLSTHGSCDVDSAHGKYKGYTALATGTRITQKVYYNILTEEAFIFYDGFKGYYAFGEPQLADSRFDDSIIVLDACESTKNQSGKGSLVQAFVDRGASAVIGFSKSVMVAVAERALFSLLQFMTYGTSVDFARDYLYQCYGNYNPNDVAINFSDGSKMTYGELIGFLRKSLSIRQPKVEPVYLFAPYPFGIDQEVDGTIITFKWDMSKSNGTYLYDLYIDGKYIATTYNKSIKVESNNAGKHTWYIVANLSGFGEEKLSYQSAQGDFYIEGGIGEDTMEAVDLGLSVKWATCNLGASKPEECGGYFQWAGLQDVTDTSINLGWNNCPYHKGSSESTGWTKYIPSSKSSYWSGPGNPDNKTVLDPEDDIAHVKLGGNWRMPTTEEFKELLANCNSEWTTVNGVTGRRFTSRKNGNSIFLPAAGYRYATDLILLERCGLYWPSSLNKDDPSSATSLLFSSDFIFEFDYSNYFRDSGLSIRPVCE